jgi:NADH:ubiquinone oxidoreductase subunit 6 (subunit J)
LTNEGVDMPIATMEPYITTIITIVIVVGALGITFPFGYMIWKAWNKHVEYCESLNKSS